MFRSFNHRAGSIGSIVGRSIGGPSIVGMWALAFASACAGSDEFHADVEEESIGIAEQPLSAGGQLEFRGNIPLFPTDISQPFGSLTLITQVNVGVADLDVFKVNHLTVCWYRPSNPDNIFRPGDPNGCTSIGVDNPEAFIDFQQCPANFVASGYEIKVNGDELDTFGLECRSLLDIDEKFFFADVGSSDRLFSEFHSCEPNQTPSKGYLEGISMNRAGDGIGGNCVVP
jgi:hypothetical protein